MLEILIVISLILLILYFMIKSKNNKNALLRIENEQEIEDEIQQILNPRYEVIVEPRQSTWIAQSTKVKIPRNNTIFTYLTGTTYNNNQTNIKKVVKTESYFLNKYDNLKGKELKEHLEYERIWEYNPFEIDLFLVHEPNNKYDSNAIAVYGDIEESLKLGYIPKEDNKSLLSIMNQHSLNAIGVVKGGKYKDLDGYEKVITKSTNYNVDIIIKYH